MATEFTIGRLAKETGCKITTIRYYERIGLLPAPGRSAGNTRLYNTTHRKRLGFIQHCRELGFSQAAIRELLELTDFPDRCCDAVTDIARGHLDDISQRITRLAVLKSELECMITNCRGGRVKQCRIIETLADHSNANCVADEHEGSPE